MDAASKLNALLSHVGEFSLDPEGRCLLEHDSGVELLIELPPETQIVTIYGALVPAQDDRLADLLTHALQLNLYQQLTRGGAVAYDPRNGWIVYTLSLDLPDLDEVAFGNALENAVAAIANLRSQLEGWKQTAPATAPDREPDSADQGGFVRV